MDSKKDFETNQKSKVKKFFGFFISRKFLLTLLIAVVAVAGYVYWKYEQATQKIDLISSNLTPEEITENNQKLLGKLGKHIMLPLEKEPTIATIVNIDMLKSQSAFFTNAKNGDRVIVYPEWAVIYDEERDLIINIVPVTNQPSDDASDNNQKPASENLPAASNVNGSDSANPENAGPAANTLINNEATLPANTNSAPAAENNTNQPNN